MTINEYQKLAMRTSNPEVDRDGMLLNGVMGLCGEAGECIDLVKKNRFQGHELDRDRLIGELGDVAWYLAEAATALGVDLEERHKKKYNACNLSHLPWNKVINPRT